MQPIDEMLDTTQLETAAASIVGQIVFVLSRLEYNLGLYLRNLVGRSDPVAIDPLIARLSFKNKIDALRDVVEHKFAGNSPCLSEFKQWHGAIDAYRAKRNSFVHGRWGTHYQEQAVINIASGLSASKPQKEARYNMAALRDELTEAREIVASFYKWCDKWPL